MSSSSSTSPFASVASFPAAEAKELAALRTRLREIDGGGLSDLERIDLIEELELLIAAFTTEARTLLNQASLSTAVAMASR